MAAGLGGVATLIGRDLAWFPIQDPTASRRPTRGPDDPLLP
jgi:hypothetical protein